MEEQPVSRTTETVCAWSIDFVRALHERPRLFRTLFRFAVGKYA